MSSEHTHRDQIRRYDRQCSVVFLKTKEAFGGLSNMASGFPLEVNGIHILTSEALYQACRFPHMPDIQRLIIDQRSPMTAKMKSKPHRDKSRPDWDRVRVAIMRWCLRVKLAQNWIDFGDLLMQTGDLPIVEQSRKDDFWGAKVEGDDTLVGMNVLGRLLMELRECLKHDPPETLRRVEPPRIPDFLLASEPIGVIGAEAGEAAKPSAEPAAAARRPVTNDFPPDSLFAGFEDRPTQPEVAKPAACRAGVEPGQPPAGGGGMIAEADTHPAYKSTAEPWLPEIPAHWRMERLKSLLRQRSEKGYPDEPLLAATQTKGVVRKEDYGSRTVVATKDLHLLKLVKRGDFVISLRSFQGGIEYARHQGIISPAYTVLHTEDATLHGYLAALFKSRPFIGNLTLYVTGIRQGQNIDYEKLSRSFVPVPPPEEQAAIVRFLAEADRRINRLIRNKRRLIELLNEQRQAIITQAVTRGLDPSVPMKASGVEWLGDVPEHWEVKRLKWVLRLQRGYDLPADQRIDGPYPVYSSGGLIDRHSDYRADPPGIVMGRYGSTDAVFFVTEPYWPHNTALFTTTLFSNDPRWCFYLLRTISKADHAGKSAVPGVDRKDLFDIVVPRPPTDEQSRIAALIGEAISEQEAAERLALQEIDYIREYRTRLIADVVTGKLDVRAAAADLPDTADTEPEPADDLDDDADLDAAEEELEEEVAS